VSVGLVVVLVLLQETAIIAIDISNILNVFTIIRRDLAIRCFKCTNPSEKKYVNITEGIE
jgi:hypothetical protein